ncbi:unnamed protein product [Cunninghamella blakesleeana]
MSNAGFILLSISMIFGPIVGYIDQYRIIVKKKSSAGFNSKTCAILLFANILRIFFWIGKRFDTTLLIQSIVMIITQLILLHIVLKYRHDPSPTTLYSNLDPITTSSNSSLSSLLDEQLEAEMNGIDIDQYNQHHRHSFLRKCYGLRHPHRFLKNFWSWDHYLDFINCLLLFTTIIALFYLFLRNSSIFIEGLGMFSLAIEASLPLPQFISNFKRKSMAGFSLLVLASWFLGDSFKLFYFIYTQAPIQFDICGGFQLSIDTLIVFQFIWYSSLVQSYLKSKYNHMNELENEEEGQGNIRL